MFNFLKKAFGPGVDLKEKLQDGAVIVDVRTKGEFASGHVKGSKNIPLNNIDGKLNQIKSWNKPVIACCASGMRSASATGIMKRNGIEAYNGGSWGKVNNMV
ncbi:MAG: rhodanese-like domain-containing protein [Bacteroidia bacterium]